MRGAHAEQVAEMEALHRRGMVAMGHEMGQKMEDGLAAQEQAHDAKVCVMPRLCSALGSGWANEKGRDKHCVRACACARARVCVCAARPRACVCVCVSE